MQNLPLRFVLLLPLLAACATDQTERKLALAEIDARHANEKAGLEEAQAAFARRWRAPLVYEFPGVGTIQVLECGLQGYEEHVELRVHYTFYNSTGRPIEGVRIAIDLVDPVTSGVRTEETKLYFPPLIPFVPDSSFTTAANIPMRGLHLRDGWEWRIRAELSKRGL